METIQAERTQTDVPVEFSFNEGGGVTGLTVNLRIKENFTNEYLDFDDLNFKAAGHTDIDLAVPEITAPTAEGFYSVSGGFDLTSINNLTSSMTSLTFEFHVTGSRTAVDKDIVQLTETQSNLQVIKALGGMGNVYVDNMVYDVNNLLTSWRSRVFPTSALAAAATDGGSGEGETETLTGTATPDGGTPELPDTVRGVLT